MIGSRLGPYEITAQLGAGGMGVVYRATDSQLGREVALKVLPAGLTADAERLARFEREAKLLAQLNHPNVAHVYGLETSGTARALVMELVEGQTLAERLAAGPLPVEQAAIARQIAEALEAAHEKGIVHRDLKPQNVKAPADGPVKVLDFGLAKAMDPRTGGASSAQRLAESPTLTQGATELGVVLGTAAYMAPEQAKGLAVDKRADIWAFGVVVFEMMSGRSLFAGETVTDTLASVLRSDVDQGLLPPATPPAIRRLLRRCLERDPKNRLHDIADARIVIDEVLSGRHREVAAPAPSRPAAWRSVGPWALAALLAIALVATLLAKRGSAPGAAATRSSVLSLRLPKGIELPLDDRGIYGQTAILAIAPDGGRIAFVGGIAEQARLYLRALDSDQATAIEGTDGASSPFFSPDGRWLGFFSGGKLRKVLLDGGRPIDVAEAASLPRGAVWCPDGSIVFTPGVANGLVRLPPEGGAPQVLTTLDTERGERTHRWPALLPGGREVAFTVGLVGQPGDYEDAAIDVVELGTGRRRPFLRGASMVRFAPSGHVLLGREGQVLAQTLDRGSLATERARPVLRRVAGVPSSGIVHFDVAADGTLVFAESDPASKARRLAWLSRDGTFEDLPLPAAEYLAPVVSPDGRRGAVSIGPGGGRSGDVWVHDFASGTVTRVTFDDRSLAPVWSPDGRRLVYTGLDSSGREVFREQLADGTQDATALRVFEDGRARVAVGWMPDGSLLWWEDGGAGSAGNLLYARGDESAPRPFVVTPAVEILGAVSPDGRYVAYGSDDGGDLSILVQPFPPTGAKWQVAASATAPRFSRDGREIYFLQGPTLMVAPISTRSTFSIGAARPLLAVPPSVRLVTDTFANYDVAPDGRFLVVRGSAEGFSATSLTVALNWSEALRRAVPPEEK